jgi:hypothetical protein
MIKGAISSGVRVAMKIACYLRPAKPLDAWCAAICTLHENCFIVSAKGMRAARPSPKVTGLPQMQAVCISIESFRYQSAYVVEIVFLVLGTSHAYNRITLHVCSKLFS